MAKKETNIPDPIFDDPRCRTTMYGAIHLTAQEYPDEPAIDFMGRKTSFRALDSRIVSAAGAFYKAGFRKGDVVTVCMPNTPQAVICLYALNRIGCVANMVHPLSSETNITFYLNYSDSKAILTVDMFYEKIAAAASAAWRHTKIFIARIQDELPVPLAAGYAFKNIRKTVKLPKDDNIVLWSRFEKTGRGVKLPPVEYDAEKTAAILYSGGTSGTPKGICLSDYNFNALGCQIAAACGTKLGPGLKFLSVMPLFHGFGLGIGIHAVLEFGVESILIPTFTRDSYAAAVVKKKPNFIAGVPTLYEALLKAEKFKDADLSFLLGVFSGGDSLSPDLKRRADKFLEEHGSPVHIREGYGLTECVTASCLTPVSKEKEGSIGLPLRGMKYRIVKPGTFKDLPANEAGEIILNGPTLMLGYLKNEETNEQVVRTDKGERWLFTGDMGCMDEDGYVYFKQRIKRMIISSGFNVYPSQIEKCLDEMPDIDYSCAIGVKDPYKMQKVRAYIVLNEGVPGTDEEKQKILEYCRKRLDHHACPKEIVFRKELPRTLVGKVAFHVLEEEAEAEEKEKAQQ